jgi:hypothetical protein
VAGNDAQELSDTYRGNTGCDMSENDPTVGRRVKKYNRKHPDKRKARSKVYIKVRAGKLSKLPAGHDYHHPDYSKPDKVVARTHKSHTQQKKK